MNPREHRIGVVGAGTMGNGIAHVFARAGFEVTLFEVAQAALDRGARDDSHEPGSRGGEGEGRSRGSGC